MSKLLGPRIGSEGRTSTGFRALVVLLCVSAVIMTVYSQEGEEGPVHTMRNAAHFAATPFDAMGSLITSPLDTLSQAVSDASADTETLSQLKSQNAQLVARVAELEQYGVENSALRAMLNLSATSGAQGVACQVIALSHDSWTDTATINVGSDKEIKPDMAVSDGACIVGAVLSVSPNSSVVRLSTDPSYSVSAVVSSSGATGVLTGSVDGALHLRYVETSKQVEVGDVVVTSGLSDVYPSGLVLGHVVSVSGTASDLYYNIVVEPYSTVSNAGDLFVITSFNPDDVLVGGE